VPNSWLVRGLGTNARVSNAFGASHTEVDPRAAKSTCLTLPISNLIEAAIANRKPARTHAVDDRRSSGNMFFTRARALDFLRSRISKNGWGMPPRFRPPGQLLGRDPGGRCKCRVKVCQWASSIVADGHETAGPPQRDAQQFRQCQIVGRRQGYWR
jgi:hypothetical protein